MKPVLLLSIILLCSCSSMQAQASPAVYAEDTGAGTENTEAVASRASATAAETPAQVPATDTQAPAAGTQTPATDQPAQAPAPQALPQTTPGYVQPIPADDSDKMSRTEKRRLKAQQFAARQDSLVQSRSFRFLPNSMQELPGGWTQLIYNELYFVGIFKDHVEVHMPIIRGGTVQYIQILNFDTFEIKDYQASKVQYGWNISFNMENENQVYTANMMVYTLTGETVLNLLTLNNTVRYVGYIQSTEKN